MHSRAQLIIAFWVALALAMTPKPAPAVPSGPGYRSSFAPIDSTPRSQHPRAPGDQLWAARFNGISTVKSNGYDVAYSVASSPDGMKVFVTGITTPPGGDGDYGTIAYDASSGRALWVRLYTSGRESDATSLGVSPDGSKVFVTGGSEQAPGDWDYATVAYDASTGAHLWVARYNGPGGLYDFAYSLGVTRDGRRVLVTGTSADSRGLLDYATVAYDASTGAQLWASRYNGPGDSSDVATFLGTSSDGSKVIVTGDSHSSDTLNDYATVAYDASTGAQLWASRYNGPANFRDFAVSLGLSPDGTRVFVTGRSGQSELTDDFATIAYDTSTGAQLWVERYDGPPHGNDSAFSLGVSPDGARVFVTGQSVALYSNLDYTTIAYDTSSGAMLWLTRYFGPRPVKRQGQDGARALAVSPDGTEVFVSGGSEANGGNYDYATVAYRTSDGGQLWVQRYNGPGNVADFALSLSLSPDGSRVFVTGRSDGPGLDPAYATIAYSTG